jgi:hypothetical protein
MAATPVTDIYAAAALQGCLASLPNAASVLQNPQVLATFIQNVTNIAAAALEQRNTVGNQSAGN